MENMEDEMENLENVKEAVPVIVKEGWLMKRGEHFKNWRPRCKFLLQLGIFLLVYELQVFCFDR